MQIKIKLTRAELLDIVSKYMGFTIAEVTIEPPVRKIMVRSNAPLSYDILQEFRKTFNSNSLIAEFIKDHPEHQIAIIKKIREMSGMGLAESKWAFQNWTRWFDWINAHGRYPKVIISSSGTSLE